MSFKYQAPENFKATSLEIAGTTYKVETGVIESDADIAHILAPHGFTTKNTIESDVDIFYALQLLGFTRAVPETKAEPKKETAAAK